MRFAWLTVWLWFAAASATAEVLSESSSATSFRSVPSDQSSTPPPLADTAYSRRFEPDCWRLPSEQDDRARIDLKSTRNLPVSVDPDLRALVTPAPAASVSGRRANAEQTVVDPAVQPLNLENDWSSVVPAQMLQNAPANENQLSGSFRDQRTGFDIGSDFYSTPDFSGLIVEGAGVAMKIGGFVKADFIYDFDPIDATDSFITTTIPVNAEPRTNARFHARQTRFSFDTRWLVDGETARVFVESDFFSEGDQLRLRHAYGALGRILVGQTWTAFTDVAAAPATLDFEGSVSAVNRRQAQIRYTDNLFFDDLTFALSLENPSSILERPAAIPGEARRPTPDFVSHVRWESDWGQFQTSGLVRQLGFQPDGRDVITGMGWGLNQTGVVALTDNNKVYFQILVGDGIGSYRSLPDVVATSAVSAKVLPLFAWMVGGTHEWNDWLSSNFTYAENLLDDSDRINQDDVSRTTYLAGNLIWHARPRINFGIEYLHGMRENVDGRLGVANRLQAAVFYYLP